MHRGLSGGTRGPWREPAVPGRHRLTLVRERRRRRRAGGREAWTCREVTWRTARRRCPIRAVATRRASSTATVLFPEPTGPVSTTKATAGGGRSCGLDSSVTDRSCQRLDDPATTIGRGRTAPTAVDRYRLDGLPVRVDEPVFEHGHRLAGVDRHRELKVAVPSACDHFLARLACRYDLPDARCSGEPAAGGSRCLR